MKFIGVLCCVSLSAAFAAACGGKSIVGTDEETTDAGETGSRSDSGTVATPSRPDASMAAMPGFSVMCTSAQTCPRSQVCCASFGFTGGGGLTVACANTCGAAGIQVCAADSECARGQVCAASPVGFGMTCQAPMNTPPSGPDAGPNSRNRDAGAPVDAGRADASTLVDAAVAEAGVVDAGVIDAGVIAEAGTTSDAALAEAGVVEAGPAPAEASVPPQGDDAGSPEDGEAGEDDATLEASTGP